MAVRSQRFVLWWGIVFTVLYGIALGLLLDMVPPPSPKLSAAEIGRFYAERHDQIRIGAVVASWCGGFLVPLFAVIVVQMLRLDLPKIWSVLTAFGGALMSIFLVLPPLFWGVAAFTQGRSSEVTSIMHELGVLTLLTTDQYYIFPWVAMTVVCFLPTAARFSPFTRRYGYFTAWTALMFEAGAIAFLPREGPFAWNGVLVLWSPLTLFGLWVAVTFTTFLRALRQQELHEPHDD